MPHHPASLRLRASVARAAAALRRVIGVPDYERYVAHLRTRHPDQPVPTREQFVRECLERRYERPGSRCC